MSFCFNFSDDENDQQNDDTNTVEVIQQTFTSSKLKAQDSDIITESGEFDPVKDALFEQHQQQKNISKHTEYTDVIHGVYEGGLKLWECSDDLLQYLSQDLPQDGFVGRRVVDLGCGHGHPGIWCVSRGSALTCFQDLNTDALRQATVPNVLRICGSDCIIKKNHTTTTAGSIVAGEATASTTQNED